MINLAQMAGSTVKALGDLEDGVRNLQQQAAGARVPTHPRNVKNNKKGPKEWKVTLCHDP